MKTMPRLSVFLYSALGVMAGYFVMARVDHWLPSAYAGNSDIVAAHGFELVDDQGRRQILVGMASEGSPAIWFFDKNGKSRLNLGLYGDGNAFVVLNDEQERAVEIFRTTGSGAPVFVMKSGGRDRIVMGLNSETQPYLVTWDEKGSKKAVFGNN